MYVLILLVHTAVHCVVKDIITLVLIRVQVHCICMYTKYYTTVDINECNTNNGGCNEICINTNGGYYCVGM